MAVKNLEISITVTPYDNGEYLAGDVENFDLGAPLGMGKTIRASIDDLIEKMADAGMLDELPEDES